MAEPTFSTREEQERKATCFHWWIHWPEKLFGYMKVRYQCIWCQTWRA